MHPELSFEQAPPISVPFRFFLTAPLFGIGAGVLLAAIGGEAFVSRWTPGTLAAVHLIVAGFMLQVMCGALLQFVPVAAGGNIWRPRLVAALVHPALVLAALLLVAAFLWQHPVLFIAATHLFAFAIGAYVLTVGWALLRTPGQGATLLALRLAVLGLAVTASLGIVLATGLARNLAWPLLDITQVHVGWGFGGWALMLVLGVAYYVVPMFQITPAYPLRLARWLPLGLVAALLLWSLQLVGGDQPWQTPVLVAGAALAATFAVTTLRLQNQRRRKVNDATLLLFRGSMVCLLAYVASLLAGEALPALGEDPRMALWLGTLAIPGVFVTVICGMLYKIVPFLGWLHLQRLGGIAITPPNMRQIIPEKAMRRQMNVHFAACSLLLAAVFEPRLAHLAGAAFVVSFGWLWWNLIGGVRVYLDFIGRIRAADASQGS